MDQIQAWLVSWATLLSFVSKLRQNSTSVNKRNILGKEGVPTRLHETEHR
jgi:hypothetical protein